MVKTKGVGLVNALAFVEAHLGAGSQARVLAKMDEADREVLASVITAGWYEAALYGRLLRVIHEVFAPQAPDVLALLGIYGADRDLNTIHRVLLRMANPAFIIEKFGDLWPRFFDAGRWEVSRNSKTSVTGTLRDFDVIEPALCVEMRSYMAHSLALTGAKDVQSAHPACRARNDKACVFALHWSG